MVNLLYHAVNKITYKVKRALDECCWSYFYKCCIALYMTIINNSFSAESIFLCRVLFAFRHRSNSLPQITSEYSLKVFWLICVQVISCKREPLRALCVHVRHRARNLSSPVCVHVCMFVCQYLSLCVCVCVCLFVCVCMCVGMSVCM